MSVIHSISEGLHKAVCPDYRRLCRTRFKYRYLQAYDIRTVLDIGANTGQFARRMRDVLGGVRLYSFEPLADCFAKLQQNFAGDGAFQAFNFALGDQAGSAVIHRSSHAPSSSLLPMADLHKTTYPHTAQSRDETISVRRLDDLADELDLTPNVLAKLDVQGFEDRVIAGGTGVLARCKVMLVEVSFEKLYEGQKLFDELYDMIRPLGLRFKGLHKQAQNPQDGRVLFGDAIFARD